MPVTLNVPAAVRSVAVEALRLHRESPLEGVGGVAIAETLTSGPALTVEHIARMRRFFTVNERHYITEMSLSHRPLTSPLMRSWGLHGGQAGKTWADAAYTEACKSGFVEEDQWVRLLRAKPAEVYEALSMGAWRWEYGMDPARAARFMEEYHRSTGVNLDIAKAFGRDRNAVSEAMIRRAQNDNPFKIVARNLLRAEYRKVAEQDMREMRKSLGRPSLNWPGLIGVAVLSSREPGLVRPIIEGHAEPPGLGRSPKQLMAYSEPMSACVAYFHPRGPRFAGNMPPGLLAEAHSLTGAIHRGDRLDEVEARTTLRKARTWTGENGLAWNVGHVLLEAWAREDWPVFLEAIPLDSPVRTPFERFAGVRSRP